MQKQNSGKRKICVFAVGMTLLFLVGKYSGWSGWLLHGNFSQALQRMTEENLLMAIFIYLVATAIGSVAFALPGIGFAILAGLLFGPVLGTICCTVAATLGAVAAFLLGRYFLKDTVGAAARKNPYLRRLLFDETGKKQIWILMITRLVPLFPYNLQNFAYGVTDMPLKTYAAGSFLFMLPGTAMYTFGTAGLAYPGIRKVCFLGAAILAVAVTTAGVLLKKKVLAEQEKTGLKNGDEV